MTAIRLQPIRRMIYCLLALTGGVLSPLAFSPFDWPWLSPFCIALLFASWLCATPWQAFARGYWFGLGQFGFGVSWVFNSMRDFGGASTAEAGGLTLLFVLSLALFPAFTGWLAVREFGEVGKHRKLLLAFPACWVLFEWLRSWYFPWLQMGSSQVGTALGQGLAPLFGVYGVSLAVAWLAGLLLCVPDRHDWRRRGAMMAIGLSIVVCAWLGRVHWTQPAGPAFKVALLQGNVPQDQKWVPAFQRATMDSYLAMTRQHWEARLIVWPETAVPAYYHQVQDGFLADLQTEAVAHHSDILLGIPWVDLASKRYYNALVGVGAEPGNYFKRHLVPFGEYLPFRPLFAWILKILEIPMSDFSSGAPGQKPIQAAGYPLAASICYEDVFGHEARDALPQAAYLVNVTNDAWFGDSFAPYQHVQMARMRALESGRYLLRATNSGVTAVIAPDGGIVSQAPLFQQASVTAEVRPMTGGTPYVWYGDWLAMGLAAGVLVFLKLDAKRRF